MLVVLARPQKKFFEKEKALRERHAAQPDVTSSWAAAKIKDTAGVVEPGGVPASGAQAQRIPQDLEAGTVEHTTSQQ
ncbi:hypothetical protein CYMTET_4635 [Cymbomonas tetramitiformis]|uniref:Uncharacterized protein n=1 Tax=Cymbomonas tetramitiformis TaxID=36881 RepID=A0AAE0H2M5_9CHLO|nr:hypothetical protein CYMTET_4635 [Cymbomonas tetramitiformis]